MNAPHYIGFDVHKKTISFCVKTASGEIVCETTTRGHFYWHSGDTSNVV